MKDRHTPLKQQNQKITVVSDMIHITTCVFIHDSVPDVFDN